MKFCFAALAHPAHVDFGGLGFLRTALKLREAGHQVDWVMSMPREAAHELRLTRVFRDCGLSYKPMLRLRLASGHQGGAYRSDAVELSGFLTDGGYDCVVVDRICVGAAAAASLARLPWACLGGDGRRWRRCRWTAGGGHALAPVLGAAPDENQSDVQVEDWCTGLDGPWAVSPFLNLVFFPRKVFDQTGADWFPEHSHFLGSGGRPPDATTRSRALITAGNSFQPILWEALVSSLLPVLRRRQIPALVLCGSESAAADLRKRTRGSDALSVAAWMSYAEAFRTARVAVGHGGTGHVWHAVQEGIPILAVPGKGDQPFLSRQVERLGIGRTTSPLPTPARRGRLGSRLRWAIGRCVALPRPILDHRSVAQAFTALLDRPLESAPHVHMAAAMAAGGGPAVAAELLERLGSRAEPIVECATGRCCC